MNVVTLVGRLTKDVDLSVSKNGIKLARFNLAVKRTKEECDFIPCVAWKASAEYLNKYASKGALISLKGAVRTGSYTTQDNRKVYTFTINADEVNILANANNQSRTTQQHGEEQVEFNNYEEVEYSEFNEADLPF